MFNNEIQCCDVLDGLNALKSDSADIVLADPPYNIGKDFGTTKDRMALTEYVDWCSAWINECVRVLKPSGTMYVYGFAEILAHLSARFPLDHRWLIWYYRNKTVPSLNFWQRGFEAVLCGWKDSALRVFNADLVRQPYTDEYAKNFGGRTRKTTPGRFGSEKETPYKVHEKGSLPRDVIECPALSGGSGFSERWFFCHTCDGAYSNKDKKGHEGHDTFQHPTQKPAGVTRRLLLAAKPAVEGTVLVPFAGSGAECAVARNLGLKYRGFDVNANYVKLANNFLLSESSNDY